MIVRSLVHTLVRASTAYLERGELERNLLLGHHHGDGMGNARKELDQLHARDPDLKKVNHGWWVGRRCVAGRRGMYGRLPAYCCGGGGSY